MTPAPSMRRALAYLAVAFIGFIAAMFPRGDRLVLTPAEEATVGFHFSLIQWEMRNAVAKWTSRAANLFRGVPGEQGAALVDRYLELTGEIRGLEEELARAAALQQDGTDAPAGGEIAGLESRLRELRAERAASRARLEEFLESEISRTVDDQGLGGPGPFLWPPVDFRMDRPPKVLVTSPRDRIERLEDVLLTPEIQVSDSARIEASILAELDLSSLVEALGGLATYPSVVPADYDLMPLLEIAAHEWLHSYLFFRPLGQNFNASPEMQTLNETLASLAGEEIGWATWSRLTGEPAPRPHLLRSDEGPPSPGGFSLNVFMRETRRRVDELLAAGRTGDAEAYMEARRVELQGHGIFLRKLNQAYFAFHGTYADSPASTSPIGPQVAEYRQLSSSIGEAVRELAGAGSYEQFLAKLDAKKSRASAYTLRMAPTTPGS